MILCHSSLSYRLSIVISIMVECTWYASVCFVVLSIVYGSAFAMTNQALKYFQPGFIQSMRMFFGFGLCLIILITRLVFSDKYRSQIQGQSSTGVWNYIHLSIGGLLNLGIPHCLIAVGQQWVPTCTVQVMMPLGTSIGAIFGHFVLEDEHFSCFKAISLLLAIIGVVLTSVPQFFTAHIEGNAGKTTIGFVLIILSMGMFGIAPAYIKWKTKSIDVTISALIQTLVSGIFGLLYSLIADGPSRISHDSQSAPAIGWMWPILAGVVSTGIAVHLFMLLLGWLGAFGANFVPFGQLITGMIISIAILKEWSAYGWWEITLSVIGLLVLIGSMAVGFLEPANSNEEETSSEEDQTNQKTHFDGLPESSLRQQSNDSHVEDVNLNEL